MVSKLMKDKQVIHGFLEVRFTNLRTGAVVEAEQVAQETDADPLYITLPVCPATDDLGVGDPVHVQVGLDGEPHTNFGGVIHDYTFPTHYSIRLNVQVSEVI